MIDEILFKTDGYFKLLKELSSYINKDFTIEDETVSYFEQYKTISPSDDDWEEDTFEKAQLFFNTTFVYEVDTSQYVGVYTDLDGRKFIVKLYHGGEISILGDTLSNWVEKEYSKIAYNDPEKFKKFQDDCYDLFGIDSSKKFSRRNALIRIIPDNNKIFIGQEYIRAYNIDEHIFKSEEYFELLKELTDWINTNFIIDDETVNYFEQYKKLLPTDDDWDENVFKCAQMYFNTEFVYEVSNSQYVGIYTDLNGRKFIVKLYHGGEFSILGETLSNWVENQYRSIVKSNPEKIKKFQADCFSLFGIDSIKKFDATEPFEIRIIPDNNKIFIGQE